MRDNFGLHGPVWGFLFIALKAKLRDFQNFRGFNKIFKRLLDTQGRGIQGT